MLVTIIFVFAFLFIVIFVAKKICDMAIKYEISKKYEALIFSKDQREALEKEKAVGEALIEEKCEEIEIISKDGLKLKGYQIKTSSDNKKWVIIVHGYLGSSSEMGRYAKKFMEYGYNVLLVDLRAHGKSEGKYIGMGWLDHFDLELWIQKVLEQDRQAKIILFGVSMGAATVMMTTGEKLPENVKVTIADCGYSSVWDEFKIHLWKIFYLPAFPLLYISSIMSKIYAGYSFKEASSIKQVKKSKIPTLFIHGTKDKFVPYEMLNKIYNNAACEKQKLEIEGAAHAESEIINPTQYWSTIQSFINKNFKT